MLNEPIEAAMTTPGRLRSLRWRGCELPVCSVLDTWPAATGHLYRVRVVMPDGRLGVAEIVGAASTWRLRTLYAATAG